MVDGHWSAGAVARTDCGEHDRLRKLRARLAGVPEPEEEPHQSEGVSKPESLTRLGEGLSALHGVRGGGGTKWRFRGRGLGRWGGAPACRSAEARMRELAGAQ